jgi:4-nitrophenyl phosphatase
LFIIGEPALHSTLATAGFHHSEDHPQAVLAGMDWSITYDKLRRATLLIRSGLPFIATNPDRTFPTPEGLVPGTGALLAALQAATDVTPQIAGKPSPEMYRIAIERMGIGIEQTLVVGDRAETDIAGAQALGCRTALVLSGVTDLAAAQAWRPAPDLIAEDLTQVVEQLGAL